jgi:hypothetical protein
MAVSVTSVKFNNEFRASQDLKFLLSCINEKVTVTVGISYEDITYSTEGNELIARPDGSEVDLFDTSDVLYSLSDLAFAETFVGDSIGLYQKDLNAFSYFTVKEKINENTIRVNTTIAPFRIVLSQDSFVFNCTPFNGLRYAYNLTDIGGSYNSLIDGELQQGTINSLDCTNTTPVSLSLSGAKSWQIGSITVKGDGAVGGGATLGTSVQQKFIITHEFIVTDYYIDLYTDLIDGTFSPRYLNEKCPNYINRIQFGRYLTDPNGLKELEIPTYKSNIGYYGENFNGGATNYSISSLVIKKGSETVSALQFGSDITVEAIVQNTVDSPFSSGNTKYVFGFMYLPDSEDYYVKNGYNQTRNLLIDRKINTLGSGSVNGDNYGNSMQVIKTLTSTVISATQMKITATINVGADAQAILQQGDYPRYQMYIITEKHSLDAEKSDKVALLLQSNEFYIQLTTTDLIKQDGIKLIFHPYTDVSDSVGGEDGDITVFPVDDIVMYAPFYIDFDGHDADEEIKILKVRNKIILRDSASLESDIILEDFSFSTSNFPIIGGKAQDISFTQDRVFKIGSEIRKTISLTRDYASDDGDELHYKLLYPFMDRWDYWEKLINLTSYPSQLFDNTKPSNGFNNLWNRLTQVGTFELFYEVDITIEQNAVQFSQTFSEKMRSIYTFSENTDWINKSIKSYDGASEVTYSGIKYIFGYKDTKIVASLEKSASPTPGQGNVGMVIWIEQFETGGISNIRRYSSFYDGDSNAWLKSTDGSNRVVITKTGNVFTGEVYVDYSKLPSGSKFTVYARLYEFYNPLAKQFEDSNDFEFEDMELYEFESFTGTSFAMGTGEAIKQDFQVIRNNPISLRGAEDVLPESEILSGKCCFDLPALAERTWTSDFKNDYHSPIFWWSDSFTSAVMKLQKSINGVWTDVKTLNVNTWGTFYSFGFNQASETNIYGDNAIGYKINWGLVLVDSTLNIGNYRVKCTGTTLFGDTIDQYSLGFNLMEYNDSRADRSVRFEWWLNGSIGDKNDDMFKRDFGINNWYNMIRLPDSRFGKDNTPQVDKTYVKYQNPLGKMVWTGSKQVQNYVFNSGAYPVELHRYIEFDILQGDEIRVTDYDINNPVKHQNRYVNWASDYTPQWDSENPYAMVELKFEQAYQNHEKKRD